MKPTSGSGRMNAIIKIVFISFVVSIVLFPVISVADEGDDWQFGASIYGWFPDITGQTSFAPPNGGGDFEVGIDQILENLEFTLMGNFDARKGKWGVMADMIYMDVGNSMSGVREGTIGNTPIPTDASADVSLNMQSWIWTMAGYYRAHEQTNSSFDLLAGLRYLDVTQDVSWNLTGNVASIPINDRTGDAEAKLENWDGIIGAKGRYAFGKDNRWFVPYYLDVGPGESDLTMQALAGLGYQFRWGEVVGFWRYLAYDLPSDKAIADIDFNGPAIGVAFRW